MFDFWMVTTIDSDHQHVLTGKKRPLFFSPERVFKNKDGEYGDATIHIGIGQVVAAEYWQDDSPSFQSIHRSKNIVRTWIIF